MTPVVVSTELDAPADQVWLAVQAPAALVHVTRGLLGLPSLTGRTSPWRVGETVTVPVYLFGLLPFSRHRITVAEMDHARMRLRSEESGGPIRTWEHAIEVTPLGAGRCRYTDSIEIEAGALTRPVRWYAHALYRMRQRRWRQLAPVLAGLASAHAQQPVGESRAPVA
jgi:hypothetical protein